MDAHWKARFFTIWSGQQFSLIGSRASQFALVWWLTIETGSATVLATATMVAILPEIFLGPVAGACVDRWSRRLVMLVADTGIALVSAGLAYLFWSDTLQIWHVYVAMAARALGGSFHFSAMLASTPLMVPDRHLTRISGLNQSVQGANGIMGPPLGALLMELMPFHGVMLVDVVTSLPAVLPLLVIAIPRPPTARRAGAVATSMWADLREGLRYVLSWPGLVILIVNAFIIRLALVPAFVLFPLLVKDHFGGGAPELGLLEAVLGVGFLSGGLILSTWGGFRRRVFTSIMAFGGLSLGFLVIASAPADMFWVGLLGVLVVGTMGSLIDGPFIAILQSTADPAIQGRVITMSISLLAISSPVGLAVAGPISDWLGLRVWYLATGLLALASTVILSLIPAVLRVEEGPNRPEPGPDRTAP